MFQTAESSIINCRVQKARIRKSWRSVSSNTLQNLISSMPDRLCNITELTLCLEVTLSSRYCTILGVATLLSIIIVAEQLSV